MIATPDYDGTKLADITKLNYTTYSNDATIAPGLQLEVKLFPTATTWEGRLVFLPGNTTPAVSTLGWHTWNTLDPTQGRWFASGQGALAANGKCPLGSPCTWAQVLANWPQAQIGNPDTNNSPLVAGRLLVRAGDSTNDYSADVYNVDAITVGVLTGANSAETTYDFEPTVPDAPTSVVATPVDNGATLSWSAPANTGGMTITGYTVTPSESGATCTSTGDTSASCTPLLNGAAVTFTVTASNAVGTGAASAASAAVTPRTTPGAPTGVTGAAGNGQVILSWTAPVSNGGSAITGYVVAGGGTCTPSPATATTCTVVGLTNGTPITFTVAATNAAGTGPASAASAAVTPRTTPGAPTGVTAEALDATATVTWTAPASNGGSAITSSTVTSAPDGVTCTATAPALTCDVAPLTNGVAYTFTVTATNAVGTGAASDPSAAVTPQSRSLAPEQDPATPVAVAPARLLDTRGHVTPASGSVTTIQVAGLHGVPSNAQAVFLNVTATG
ncbi:MAG TPA: fibronectin type III domain-containing protein, partial [Acidimicrobiales bacterium]